MNASASDNKSQLATPPASSQASSSQIAHFGGSQNRDKFSQSSIYNDFANSQNAQGWMPPWTQEMEDDMHREVSIPNDFGDDDAYDNYQLYGVVNTKIVGCRFYGGRATVGEYVKVRREPSNPYDSNALRIDNVMGDQIGHIGRNVAAKLAPFMDSTSLLVEGALTGEKTFYDCPIALKLFGSCDAVIAANLKAEMQKHNLPVKELIQSEKEREKRAKELAEQKQAREKAAAAMRKDGNVVFDQEGPNKYSNLTQSQGLGSSQDSMENLLNGTATYNPRELQNVVDTLGGGEDELSKMPMTEQPDMVATKLLPYQKQGLKWMLDHESPQLPADGSEEVVQLWKRTRNFYTNIATSFSVQKSPELASGGILCDDMGLGKTLQVISLIMADPKKSKAPTLIIAPLSVMSNWSSQAAHHVKKKFAPRVLTYHRSQNRGLTPEEFKEYEIVITTYQTMTQELFPTGKTTPEKLPTKRGLFATTWRRIVLDEGQSIRNPKTKMAQAACALLAQSRWILTGTPIVNSLKDIFSYVKFLRLSGGLTEFEIFNSTLIRPVKNGNPGARLLLQALISTLCLRRMKNMKFVDLKLPKIEFHKYPVKFLPHEQDRYDAFKAEAKGLVEAVKAKKKDTSMTHLLEVLLRLRQTCNHWKMCGEDRIKKLLELVEEGKILDVMKPENRKALQDLLQLRIDGQEDCPICIDSIKKPVITGCGHSYCRECVEKVINTQGRCPMCRAELTDAEKLVDPAAGFGEGEEALIDIDVDTSSSKIEALVKVLKASDKHSTKTVVFSQWISFLDLVQAQLQKKGLNYTRLDGKMSSTARDAAIEAIDSDPTCKILLASLSVCSVGLNLAAANQVILADSWWAPAIEDQAVDRVHRLGQSRACKVIRFVIEGTIEDEVLEIQTKKRELASVAFDDHEGTRNRKETRAGTLKDIEKLLG